MLLFCSQAVRKPESRQEGTRMAKANSSAGLRRALLLAAAAASAATAALASETISYGYDARGRLVKVVRAGPVNSTTEYKHDKADNRTARETK